MITLKMAWWLGLASVVMFVGSLLAMPVLLGQIPADYFLPERMADADRKHPLLRWMLFGLKNLLGTVLLLAGVVMLFTPGQGVLTILVGLFLLDFPGKRRLELWLIRRPRVLE